MNSTRRTFLKQAAAISIGPGACQAAFGATDGPFSIEVLGDIHFDRLAHHDMDWVVREKPHDVRQIENYSRITEENYPALLQSLKAGIANTPDCRGVIQVGDLVEGLCGTKELALLQCREAIASLRDLNLSVPVWVTKGNHDITGPGALEAYEEIVVPFCGADIDAPNPSQFTRDESNWLVVMFDGYANDSLEWLERTLANRNPGRLLVALHQPVVPYNARSAWCTYGQSPKRERLVRLLGKNRAIVLSGHLHKYAFVERDTEEGSLTQLAVSSVAYRLDTEPKDLITGIENYTPDLVDLEPRHSPDTINERRAILTAEKPRIRRFDYGDFWGRAKLRIQGNRIEADIFQRLSTKPWKTIDLTPGAA